MMIVRKSRAEVEKMRKAGQIVGDVHRMLRDLVRPGVSTQELDRRAETMIRQAGATPTFKGYAVGREVFPATLCVSINEEIVHGIPSNRVLEDGDVITAPADANREQETADVVQLDSFRKNPS